MISIIIPVYNAEKYLCSTVDSILSQNSLDYELLLIDDGSQDQSGKICDEYASQDCRVRVFHKQNGGVSSARNLGIDKATGEWIFFVDSDDIVLPSALEFISTCISDNVNCDLFIFRHQCNGEPVDVSLSPDLTVDEYLRKLLAYKIVSSPWAKLYRTVYVKKIRFNQNLRIGEDLLFNVEYVSLIDKNNHIKYFDVEVYSYICRQDSAMHASNIGSEYIQLNRIALPVMRRILGIHYSSNIALFGAINLFSSFWMLRKFPEKDEIAQMQKLVTQINNLKPTDIITRYLFLLKKSKLLAFLYLKFRYFKSNFKKIANKYDNIKKRIKVLSQGR